MTAPARSWWLDAACVGAEPRQFDADTHPRKAGPSGGSAAVPASAVRVIKTYCRPCPVKHACLEEALRDRLIGIRGGALLVHDRDSVYGPSRVMTP